MSDDTMQAAREWAREIADVQNNWEAGRIGGVAYGHQLGRLLDSQMVVKAAIALLDAAVEIERLRAALVEVTQQLDELSTSAERDMKLNQEEDPGGYWSLRTANCFAPARKALGKAHAALGETGR